MVLKFGLKWLKELHKLNTTSYWRWKKCSTIKSHLNYVRKAWEKAAAKVLLEVLEIICGSTLAVFCRGFLLTLAMQLTEHEKMMETDIQTSEGWVAGWPCNYPLPRYRYSIEQFTPLHKDQQHKIDQLYLPVNKEGFSLEKIPRQQRLPHKACNLSQLFEETSHVSPTMFI